MRKLELCKEAIPQNLRLFLSFAEVICDSSGIDAAKSGDVKRAVEEPCANIIAHGYADQPPGTITLAGYREDGRLIVTISDWGTPFHPDDVPPPDLSSDWQDRQLGGLGWHLVRKTVNELRYETLEGENRLTLVINLEEA